MSKPEFSVAKMKVVRAKMADLVPDPMNARKGKVSAIADSLRELGQHRPLVVREDNMQIVAGNHTYKAAMALGWEEIDIVLVDDDDIKALRRSLADNRTGELAVWDKDMLRELVNVAGDDIPGFDQKFLDSLEDLTIDVDDEDEPIYPIVPQFSEKHACIIIVAHNETDWSFLQTVLEMGREKSFKNDGIGNSHVISAERFGELWRSRT